MRSCWWVTVLALSVAAFGVRLALIRVYWSGGYDLQIYRYFGARALHGLNPYTASARGEIPGVYGDNQPFEFLGLAGLLGIHNAAGTLRVFFALVEAVTVAVIGFAFPGRSQRWRLAVMTFYAFSPFQLVSWTAISEDKPVTILLFVLALAAVERARCVTAWACSAVLFPVKWISVGYAVPLFVWTWRLRGRKAAVIALIGFAAVGALSEVPWFPESLRAFDRRDARINGQPYGQAVTVVLVRLGIYDHSIVRPFIVVALLVIYLAHARGWLTTCEAMVLIVFSLFVLLPDESFDRTAQIAIPFLFIIRLTRTRMVLVWLGSLVAGLAVHATVLGGIVPRVGRLPGSIERIAGAYGSLPDVAWVNIPLVLSVAMFAIDVAQRRSKRSGAAVVVGAAATR